MCDFWGLRFGQGTKNELRKKSFFQRFNFFQGEKKTELVGLSLQNGVP